MADEREKRAREVCQGIVTAASFGDIAAILAFVREAMDWQRELDAKIAESHKMGAPYRGCNATINAIAAAIREGE